MQRRALRLSRPIYEALPWFYLACGLAALAASYVLTSPVLSVLMGVPGILSLLAGVVVLLRRRAYRERRSQYGNPDSLSGKDD